MLKRLNNTIDHEDSDIDVTPMMDVVFIMLIFFIVTASFVKESGIGLYVPPASEPQAPVQPPIVVNVTDADTILIQDRIVNSHTIHPTITRLMAETPEASVVVKVDKKAKTKFMVQAVDGIRAASVNFPAVSLLET